MSGWKIITLEHDRVGKQIHVFADHQPITSYLYTDELPVLQKPVLNPLRSPRGTIVTRRFPLAGKANERTDHPHHIGAWLNYGNVNGIDFWNNSGNAKPERQLTLGTIRHDDVLAIHEGECGQLEVSAKWQNHAGETLLDELTTFGFAANDDLHAIDRTTTLTASAGDVLLKDDKEGCLGIRIARELETPADAPVSVTDADGKPLDEPVLDNTGVGGVYESSEGITGDDVWATRGRWVKLTGAVEGEDVTIAVLDHPDNPGYPTYWHARGYGLFAANPFGQAMFSKGTEELNLQLAADEGLTLQYRILLASEHLSNDALEVEWNLFANGR